MNAEQIIDLVKKLKTEPERSNFEAQWQECADYGLPNANQITIKSSPGSTKKDLFDTTAEESIVQASAGLYSYMFPTDNKAFMLKVDSEELSDIDDVKQWLSKATDIIHDYFIKTNFRRSFFQFLKYLMCFGTSVLYEDKGKRDPINFICHHVANILFTEDAEGHVDQVFREFEYTARQAIQEFGDKVHPDIKKNETSNPTKKFPFIHAVYPRDKYKEGAIDPLSMRYAEKYIDVDHKAEIEESGHPEMPYMIDRLDKDSLEKHGRSPMMRKLPDVKMLNEMKKIRIKGWGKMVDPPAIVPDDGSIWPLATQPGGVIYRRGDAQIDYLEYKGNMQGFEEAIMSVREEIRIGFALNIFDPLTDHRNMTAFEVDARTQAKLRQTVPLVGQRQSDLFNPLIHRTIGLLLRAGKLPPLPDALVDVDYSIQYLGQIALSLKQLDVLGWMKVQEQIKPFAEMGDVAKVQEILDNFEIDLIYRDSARNNGVPATWIKAEQQRNKERQARAEAQQAQAMMAQANDLSKAYKNVSQTPEEGSIAEGLNG